MYPNYTYYPQQQQAAPTAPNYQNYYRQAQPQVILKGRQVSSLEEARATSIDFDGSVFYFPDLANKRIYTKQINIDGTATLNMYELKALPVVNEQQNIASMNFVTREEFEQVIAQLRSQATTTPVEQSVQLAAAESPVKQDVINYF